MLTQHELGEAFDNAFAYKIGDLVSMKRHVAAMTAEGEINGGQRPSQFGTSGLIGCPPPMQITSRLIEQCHGGTQIHYTCAFVGGEHKDRTIKQNYFEFELVEYDDAVRAVEKAFPLKPK